jgi:hypothetical protein
MFKRLTTLALAGALSAGLLAAALGSQGSGCLPTTGTVSGLTMTQNINAAIAALTSSFSGASAPSTDCTGSPVKGQVWLDTSVTPNVMKQYDGTSWTLLGALDSSNHLWAPPVGGGTATVASAAGITDIWANSASSITISGTNTITGLANASAVPGTVKVVTAGGAFTLTNGTALELPSGANITVAAGDRFLAIAKNPTNVAVFAYTKADGSAITNPSVPIGTILYGMWGTIPPKTVYGSSQPLLRATYPDYVNAVTRTQNGTLTSGQATIVSVANTAGMGPGMPIEGTGIQAGTTVASVTSSTIVMSQAATQSITTSVRVFFTGYGFGGDSTTVGAPDCRGRTMAGRDDAYFGAPGRLTTALSGINATAINASGGLQNQILAQAKFPNVGLAFSGSGAVSVNSGGALVPQGSAGLINTQNIQASGTGSAWLGVPTNTNGNAALTSTGTTTVSGSTSSINGGVAQEGLIMVQPTLVAECVVVVLP